MAINQLMLGELNLPAVRWVSFLNQSGSFMRSLLLDGSVADGQQTSTSIEG